MSPTTIGLIGFAALFVLLALRMPIGIAMTLTGIVGIAHLNNLDAALGILGSFFYSYSSVYTLSVIPLFVLMGNFAAVSGMGTDLYRAAYAWVGHRRGGLASATIIACAGFAALSGSSVASAVTMGKVSLPEMRRYNYDARLATGAVAAGGTLGILIPPSTVLIVYGLLTEQSIGRLFLAGFLPGILLALLFVATVAVVGFLQPHFGPPGEVRNLSVKIAELGRAGPLLGIVVIVIGGIYLGVFAITEAAGIGCFLTMLYAIWRRALSFKSLATGLLETVRTTAMVFLILIGAHFFAPFLAMTRIPADLTGMLVQLAIPPVMVLVLILGAYIALGMFLEGFAMMVLTLPVVFPIVSTLGYDPIWFGIIMVIVLEMGLISPPVGINVFVVKGVAEDVPMGKIFAGILPFWLAMAVCVALLIAFPSIALVVPNTMMQ
ncbi:MAG TPA: TRAP transporter large permease [Candidatus Binatia bacterium]|nr:TRAP transporter large permease [Candidatus Binatia bacterium]